LKSAIFPAPVESASSTEGGAFQQPTVMRTLIFDTPPQHLIFIPAVIRPSPARVDEAPGNIRALWMMPGSRGWRAKFGLSPRRPGDCGKDGGLEILLLPAWRRMAGG